MSTQWWPMQDQNDEQRTGIAREVLKQEYDVSRFVPERSPVNSTPSELKLEECSKVSCEATLLIPAGRSTYMNTIAKRQQILGMYQGQRFSTVSFVGDRWREKDL